MAPRMIGSGAWSPPIASTANRIDAAPSTTHAGPEKERRRTIALERLEVAGGLGGVGFDDGSTLILAAVGANAVGHHRTAAVVAIHDRGRRFVLVGPSSPDFGLRFPPFRYRHR